MGPMATPPQAPAPTVLLAGATGLVGQQLARQFSTEWPQPSRLLALVRQSGRAPAGCAEQVVDYATLSSTPLPAARTAVCALGTTLAVAGSPEAFRAVDLDAVLAFARASQQAGVRCFALVSALGASPTSGNFYSRTKGEAEQALRGLGFDALLIARPSLLAGDRAALGQPARRAEAWGLTVAQGLGPLVPLRWRPLPAATLARALWRAALRPAPGVTVLDSATLQRLGR
jgi:uncharacterized protein YbjT (DUF2867 family)